MTILKNPTVNKIEDVITKTKKGHVLILVYTPNQKDALSKIIDAVRDYANRSRTKADFYEAIISGDNRDIRKQFEVGNYPMLMVFSGGWLQYKTSLDTSEKTDIAIKAVDKLPKLEFAKERLGAVS